MRKTKTKLMKDLPNSLGIQRLRHCPGKHKQNRVPPSGRLSIPTPFLSFRLLSADETQSGFSTVGTGSVS